MVAALAGTGMLPPVLLKAVVNRNWRESLKERFGGGDWEDAAAVVQDCVWFHAASVGEVGGVAPLVTAFRQEFAARSVLISTTSTTGKQEALKRGLSEAVCLLTLDQPYFVRRVLDGVNPRLVVISETELWPNLFFALSKRDIPVALVNGRISDYSFPRYRKIRSLIAPALSLLHLACVQTELDAERFAALGVPEERIVVTGSTKYDHSVQAVSEEDKAQLAISFGVSREQPCFVAGSVREHEDEIVIKAFVAARKQMPELQMIIAPRHPERFEQVASLLGRADLRFQRRSADSKSDTGVLLLDTLGELKKAYSLASFAFVGGSLVDIGGHNPLEPAAYQVPVIVGPHTSNVRDAIWSLRQSKAVFEVDGIEDLEATLIKLARDKDLRTESGQGAYTVWQSNLGATERIMAHLRPFIG